MTDDVQLTKDIPPPLDLTSQEISAKDESITLPQVKTPADARTEAISTALHEAYQKASTLKLTPEEAKALSADFPDEAFRLGAGGNPDLIYIEHAYLRQRLNEILGVGAAVPIKRRDWADKSTRWNWKKKIEEEITVIYVDLCLVVRGCLVGESIGEHIYYHENRNNAYSDSLEAAKSNAFRRCCKEFGVGLQAWKQGWGDGWKERMGKPKSKQKTEYTVKPKTNPKTKPAKKEEIVTDKPHGTEKTKKWMFKHLSQFDDIILHKFAVEEGYILENEPLDAWTLQRVPVTKPELSVLVRKIEEFIQEETEFGTEKTSSDNEFTESFWDAVVTVPRAGSTKKEYMNSPDTIKSLYQETKSGNEFAKKRLWGLAKEWTPQPWTNRAGNKVEPSKEDHDCRTAFDQFLEWHEASGEEQ